MRSTLSRRLASVASASALAAAGLLAAPGAATASPHHHRTSHCYQAPVQSDPHLSVRRARGGAVATVSVSHGLSGHARLSVRPGRTYTVAVSHGSGSQLVPTKPGMTYHLTATFRGSGHSCVVGGSDSATYRNGWVRGASSTVSNNVDIVLASSGTRQPPATVTSVASGPDFTTALLALLGAGLVGAGATSIAVNRRRNRATS